MVLNIFFIILIQAKCRPYLITCSISRFHILNHSLVFDVLDGN